MPNCTRNKIIAKLTWHWRRGRIWWCRRSWTLFSNWSHHGAGLRHSCRPFLSDLWWLAGYWFE